MLVGNVKVRNWIASSVDEIAAGILLSCCIRNVAIDSSVASVIYFPLKRWSKSKPACRKLVTRKLFNMPLLKLPEPGHVILIKSLRSLKTWQKFISPSEPEGTIL